LDRPLPVFPCCYLPSVEYFTIAATFNALLIDPQHQYIKQTVMNRCFILGANGIQCLTVPVHSTNGKTVAVEHIRISNAERWQHRHWQAITSAYGRSAYFEFYADVLKPFYTERYDSLFEYNMQLFRAVLNILGLKLSVLNEGIKGQDFTLLGNCSTTEHVLTFPTAPYSQVFSYKFPFIANLSVLDILFNKGSL
jgi:hypothetical protein